MILFSNQKDVVVLISVQLPKFCRANAFGNSVVWFLSFIISENRKLFALRDKEADQGRNLREKLCSLELKSFYSIFGEKEGDRTGSGRDWN